MEAVSFSGDPKDACFPASKIAKALGIDWPVESEPSDKDATGGNE